MKWVIMTPGGSELARAKNQRNAIRRGRSLARTRGAVDLCVEGKGYTRGGKEVVDLYHIMSVYSDGSVSRV